MSISASSSSVMSTRKSSHEFYPDLLHIRKTNSGISSSSLSYSLEDGADLISFADGTCATEMSSRPPSATSFLDDDLLLQPTTTQVRQVPPKSNKNCLYVMVSGTCFSVPHAVFDKLRQLKDWRHDLYDGYWHLKTSPAIFEILLSHIMFETLPAYDTLSKAEYDEFEPMAMTLGLLNLIEHFDRSSDKRLRRSKRRSFTSNKNKQGTSLVLNSENVNATSVKLMAANGKCARFVASLTRLGWKARGRKATTTTTKTKTKKKTMTHQECCASSELVN